ncbi:nuclease [[Haemophilus] felis]|nr:nuclease [[Haemophilus] felis]
MYKLIFTLLMCCITMFSYAAPKQRNLTCRVVSVADGDTLTCSLKNNKKIKVRLAEIDAPEKAQPFGKKSRQLLGRLVHKREVLLVVSGYDRYQRTVATVYNGQNRNINLIMVQEGMAWAYERYAKDPRYLAAQRQAERKRIGLWRDPQPIKPEEWRKSHK